MWCSSVRGENSCHQSTATGRALLITSLVPRNSALDGCETGQQSNSWWSLWHRGQLSVSAKTRSKNKERGSRKKPKKPNPGSKNIATTRWQSPLEIAAWLWTGSGCSLSFQSQALPFPVSEWILTNRIFTCTTGSRLTQSDLCAALFSRRNPRDSPCGGAQREGWSSVFTRGL